MKFLPVLVFVSCSVLVVMIYQAVDQELQIRNSRARMLESSNEVKKKEQDIIEEKKKIQDLNQKLMPLNIKKDELSTMKAQSLKAIDEMDKNLQTCNTEKEETEKKMTSLTEDLSNIKDEHEKAKKKAEEDVKQLKQQILDRDKAICAFLDDTKEQGRKLCGMAKAKR